MSGLLAMLWAAATDDEILQRLKEVLARPEFGERKDSFSWFLRFFDWLGDLYFNDPFLYYVLLTSCLVLLVLLISHIVWTVVRVMSFSRRHGSTEETPEARRQRLSAEHLAEARRRADQGDFTEAIRFLFLSLVHRFDESGQVGLRQDLTNREYLALFNHREAVQSRLRVFVDTLDENWYGQHPTARIQYEDCWQLFQAL